jgi:hypothetical protein
VLLWEELDAEDEPLGALAALVVVEVVVGVEPLAATAALVAAETLPVLEPLAALAPDEGALAPVALRAGALGAVLATVLGLRAIALAVSAAVVGSGSKVTVRVNE